MAFEDEGFVILSDVISPEQCDELIAAISDRQSRKPGARDLLAKRVVVRTAERLHQHLLGLGLLSRHHQAVQCSLFAKGGDASWSVTPHQDLSVPLAERVDVVGWSGWSRKEGVWFVQPPEAFLQRLVAVRVQLDGDAAETGPLEVVSGSHALGRLASAAVSEHAGRRIKCLVPRGGALVMRPLLIHSSSKPRTALPRRVLHFVYGPSLPAGLSWPSHGSGESNDLHGLELNQTLAEN